MFPSLPTTRRDIQPSCSWWSRCPVWWRTLPADIVVTATCWPERVNTALFDLGSDWWLEISWRYTSTAMVDTEELRWLPKVCWQLMGLPQKKQQVNRLASTLSYSDPNPSFHGYDASVKTMLLCSMRYAWNECPSIYHIVKPLSKVQVASSAQKNQFKTSWCTQGSTHNIHTKKDRTTYFCANRVAKPCHRSFWPDKLLALFFTFWVVCN